VSHRTVVAWLPGFDIGCWAENGRAGSVSLGGSRSRGEPCTPQPLEPHTPRSPSPCSIVNSFNLVPAAPTLPEVGDINATPGASPFFAVGPSSPKPAAATVFAAIEPSRAHVTHAAGPSSTRAKAGRLEPTPPASVVPATVHAPPCFRCNSDRGRFFLRWYSQCLLRHGQDMLQAAAHAFGPMYLHSSDALGIDAGTAADIMHQNDGGRLPPIPGRGRPHRALSSGTHREVRARVGIAAPQLVLKVPGIHWHTRHDSRAAECTAGMYATGALRTACADATSAVNSRCAGHVAASAGRVASVQAPGNAAFCISDTLGTAAAAHAQTSQLHDPFRASAPAAGGSAAASNDASSDSMWFYERVAQLAARHGAVLDFTCLEMSDDQHSPEASSAPHTLVRAVAAAARAAGAPMSGENALYCTDERALRTMAQHAVREGMESLAFLRITPEMADHAAAAASRSPWRARLCRLLHCSRLSPAAMAADAGWNAVAQLARYLRAGRPDMS